MIVYHVDKFGMLSPGQVVSSAAKPEFPGICNNISICQINRFFDNKLQMFALQSLMEAETSNNAWLLTEAILEYVRALKFPNIPSRLSVLYASRTIAVAEQWLCAMLPENPAACILSLYTRRKVYSANYALRDELFVGISEFAVGKKPLQLSRILAFAFPAAMRYWQSIAPSPRALSLGNMGHEELLLVPPVRVISCVAP